MKEKERFIPLPAKETFLLIIREDGTYFESKFLDATSNYDNEFIFDVFEPKIRRRKSELIMSISKYDFIINENKFKQIFNSNEFVKLIIGIPDKLLVIVKSCLISEMDINISTDGEYNKVTFIPNELPVTVLDRNKVTWQK